MAVVTATSVSPTTTASPTKEQSASSKLTANFDSFLKLLTTQLSNQDPLSPLDPTQFTTQLAQFSAVEQAINTNTKLAQLISDQQSGQVASSVSYLGKVIEAQGDTATLDSGHAEWSYTLAADANTVNVQILNAQGQIVRTVAGPTQQGSHAVVWDGRDDAGNTLPDGSYRMVVTARDADSNPVGVTTNFTGRVTGVSLTGGQIMLDTLGSTVALTNVISVHEPSVTTN
ncbi:MAG: flagellar hook capping FlgD N-terminal domain-containing protein [Alphaproteobacteria bacterium]